MSDIKDIFNAVAASVQETFNTDMGVASFRIPIYQREYSWDKDNIERILDDIYEGVLELEQAKDSIAFIGTMILVDEGSNKEKTFDGKSLSIVDGQQRLTTLLVLCCSIHLKLGQYKITKDTWPQDSLSSIVEEELKFLSDQLFSCSVGRPSGPATTNIYDYFPRIVREATDVRAATASTAKYESLIADYIFQFSDHVMNPSEDKFIFKPAQTGRTKDSFVERLQIIETYIDKLIKDENNTFPSTLNLTEKPNFRQALFPKLQQREDKIRDVIKNVKKSPNHPSVPAIRLIAIGNFLIHRVAVTRVIADEERFAFAIFEALNTTGEPLTAIETFKPLVIQFENQQDKKYVGSPSNKAFDIIENHIKSFPHYDDQQRETRELVVLHALLVKGEKIAFHLNSQRTYLRGTYQKIAQIDAKRGFTQSLADLSEYRRLFWSAEALPNQLRQHPEKEVALFCLDFIRNLKNSLAIPVLVRYWKRSEQSEDPSDFISAVKAVTAFLVLRRAATGGTSGIDGDYRNLMYLGGLKVKDGRHPLCIGILAEESKLPDVEVLKKYLASYLKNSKLKIQSKENWTQRVTQQPLYSSGPVALCRFILLAVAHNSIPNSVDGYLLNKDKSHPGRDYINLNRWRAPELSTVEHIAPQSKNSGWDPDLYEDINLINRIGNLTLLPERHNSSIGDKPWSTKRIFYNAAAAGSKDEVEVQIQKARDQGVDFGKKTNEMLRQGGVLPVLASVGAADYWNAEIVQKRSENIANLLWEELKDWIGFD